MSAPVVLITGCSTGIGAALAREYASTGAIVYATARKVEALDDLPESIHKLSLDVISEESCMDAVGTIIGEQSRIDILVLNAGAGGAGALLDWTVDQAKETFEVNLFGNMRLVSIVIPYMIKRRSGIICPLGSVVGDMPTPWTGVYSMSKAALHAYADVLAIEVAPFNIHVMLCVAGGVKSSFGEKQSAVAKRSFNGATKGLYAPCSDAIMERANLGQTWSMPTTTFAQLFVKASLRTKPPAELRIGGFQSVWNLWIVSWLPRWLWHAIFYRRFKLHTMESKKKR